MANNRMLQIINEYSQCKEFDNYDLCLDALDHGDVKVTIKKPGVTFERTIRFNESLSFITDTFSYPPTITPTSKDIASNSVKMAYFNSWGNLIVEHEDSVEEFKVQSKHKDKVVGILRDRLGSKFKS